MIQKPTKPVKVEFNLQFFIALSDVVDGFNKWRIWLALSWQEFRSTYHRSVLGILWVTLSFAGLIFIKITIFSSLLPAGEPGYYDTFLVTGFFVWFYLSQSVSSAPDTLVGSQSWIKSEPLPITVYIYKNVAREFYGLLLTSFVVIAALYYIGYPVDPASVPISLLAIPFFLLNAFSAKLLFGIVGAKFRDFSHLIKAIMLPMMFLTPIFWMPSQMQGLMPYLWWNPFYHYLEIFRAPILDGVFPTTSWIFVGVVYSTLVLVGMVLFARFRQRIVFWF